MSIIDDSAIPYVYDGIKNIYAFSDVHADLDSLIIILRDCAKVITSTNLEDPFYYKKYATMDISNHDGEFVDETSFLYADDLGFKWIAPPSTFVVIVGDIVDGHRSVSTRNEYEEYSNQEIKILRFLNKINSYARYTGGKILKLCGNHEFFNIFEFPGLGTTFISNHNSANIIGQQYRSINRVDLFKHKLGKELLANQHEKLPFCLIARINEYIFVHGGLNLNVAEPIKDIDSYINNANKILNKALHLHTLSGSEKFILDLLQLRDFSDVKEINKHINDNSFAHCHSLINKLNKICESCGTKYKLVVGHSIQSEASWKNLSNSTYKNIYKLDNNTQVLKGDIISDDVLDHVYIGASKTSHTDPDGIQLFNMAVDCYNGEMPIMSTSFQLYRVDSGASRAFDQKGFFSINPVSPIQDNTLLNFPELDFNLYKNSIKKILYKYFLSRTPSVLHITPTHNEIIRSNLINTLRFQNRKIFDQIAEPNRSKFIKIIFELDNSFPQLEHVAGQNAVGGYQFPNLKKYNKYINKLNSIFLN